MKNYTLNQFYFEAQALVAKYQMKGVTLKCEFELEDDGSGPKLTFHIHLEASNRRDWLASGWASSPEYALSEFEKDLMKQSGRSLSANNYSVELPDDNADSRA